MRGKDAILQHYSTFKAMMDNQDQLVTLKTMNPLIVFEWMLMKDQQQQVASWMKAMIARDMKQHVESKTKKIRTKQMPKGRAPVRTGIASCLSSHRQD